MYEKKVVRKKLTIFLMITKRDIILDIPRVPSSDSLAFLLSFFPPFSIFVIPGATPTDSECDVAQCAASNDIYTYVRRRYYRI